MMNTAIKMLTGPSADKAADLALGAILGILNGFAVWHFLNLFAA